MLKGLGGSAVPRKKASVPQCLHPRAPGKGCSYAIKSVNQFTSFWHSRQFLGTFIRKWTSKARDLAGLDDFGCNPILTLTSKAEREDDQETLSTHTSTATALTNHGNCFVIVYKG